MRKKERDLQLNHVLEKLPAAAYTCDADGLITYFNQQAVELWGRAPKLNDDVDRFCGSFKLFAADGTPITHDRCWMALALKTGEQFNAEEIVVERPDGSRATVLAHANPIRKESGKVIGAVNVLVDISDRKRAEVAQALLAAIVESSDDAIVGKNLDGIITSWNRGAERIFGYTGAEILGRPITTLAAPGRADEMPRILERLKQGERIEHYETVRRTKDGRNIDVSLTISPIRDAAGRIVGASKIARDITERKLHEKMLKEADRRKDEFLAILAHELRNPLAPISNCVQILGLSDDLGPNLEHVRNIMEQQVRHMVRLVDDLLEVSRINRGKIELRKEPVELAAVIRGAIETSRPLIEAAGHQLAISICPEAMTLEADPVRLTQVIANLLNNAAKYTEHGGQIWLTARREGEEAVVSVRDTGLGIPPEMLPHVFDMFAQAGSTLDRAQGGLGIGLTLVKKLVNLHGGKVEAHSEGVGKGSEFVIRLPVAYVQPWPPVPSSPVRAASVMRTRRILIVDDTRAAAYTLGKLLEALGQTVLTEHDARSALECLRVERPDVVISDIGMPSMDGYEFARRVRQDPGMDGLILVALTGYAQESDRQQAKEAGFDYHLIKPVSLEALGDLLSSLPSPVLPTVGASHNA